MVLVIAEGAEEVEVVELPLSPLLCVFFFFTSPFDKEDVVIIAGLRISPNVEKPGPAGDISIRLGVSVVVVGFAVEHDAGCRKRGWNVKEIIDVISQSS